MVYVIHLDLIEQRAQTERLLTGLAAVMGAEGEVADPDEMRRAYDEFLASTPDKPIDRDKLELMQVLGIA